MLVLSRKQNQTVVIDNQIEIEVLKIKGNTVRLGIKAPSHIKVLRGELAPFEIEVNLSDLGDSRTSSSSEVQRGRGSKAVKSAPLANPFAVVPVASS